LAGIPQQGGKKLANKKEDYLFLSALLRAREARMLTRERAERMLDAASFGEAAKMLTDCGYKDYSDLSVKEVEQRPQRPPFRRIRGDGPHDAQ
jgi:hypothetical protein